MVAIQKYETYHTIKFFLEKSTFFEIYIELINLVENWYIQTHCEMFVEAPNTRI